MDDHFFACGTETCLARYHRSKPLELIYSKYIYTQRLKLLDSSASNKLIAISFYPLLPEIRKKIYKHLLAGVRVGFSKDHWGNDDSEMYIFRARAKGGLHPGILAISHQVVQEASDILYGEQCFFYQSGSVQKQDMTPARLWLSFPSYKLEDIT